MATAAERQARRRARLKEVGIKPVTINIPAHAEADFQTAARLILEAFQAHGGTLTLDCLRDLGNGRRVGLNKRG